MGDSKPSELTPAIVVKTMQMGRLPRRDMARLLGCDVGTIIKYENTGILNAQKKGNANVYVVWDAVMAVITALRETAAGRSKDDAVQDLEAQKLQADVDLKRARAKKAVLEADEIEGKLHSAEDVEAVLTDLVFATRSALLALPGRLAVDLAVTSSAKEVSVRIEHEATAILDELSRYKYDPAEFRRRIRERGNGNADDED